jgi:hypothetical protein
MIGVPNANKMRALKSTIWSTVSKSTIWSTAGKSTARLAEVQLLSAVRMMHRSGHAPLRITSLYKSTICGPSIYGSIDRPKSAVLKLKQPFFLRTSEHPQHTETAMTYSCSSHAFETREVDTMRTGDLSAEAVAASLAFSSWALASFLFGNSGNFVKRTVRVL